MIRDLLRVVVEEDTTTKCTQNEKLNKNRSLASPFNSTLMYGWLSWSSHEFVITQYSFYWQPRRLDKDYGKH